MSFRSLFFFFALCLSLLAGCARRIGDGCATSIECSPNGDRRCDITPPGGYCTIPECEPDRCPDDALCIEFNAQLPRLTRRFCMAACQQDSDCRGGYKCLPPTNTDNICPMPDPTTEQALIPCHRIVDTTRTRKRYCSLAP